MNDDTKISADTFATQVSELIRHRKTTKVLSITGQPPNPPHHDTASFRSLVLDAIADAGNAPFHYNRKVDSLAEPWRFHILWENECRFLSSRIKDWVEDVKPTNKLSAMLAACGCLVLINWLPQRDEQTQHEKQIQINEEHLAATAAATQNLLLKLTAHRFLTYWSSGGLLRSRQMFDKLGIPQNQKLLSAIFIHDGQLNNQVECIAGKNRSLRSSFRHWTREVSLDS